jgi:hypothetical protein
MNDDERRTTEHITRVARETYNAPPPTPRAEMWSEIEARLDGAEGARPDRDVLPLAPRRAEQPARSRSLPWWLGIAAALVIGLGIGRLGFDRGVTTGPDRATPPLAEAPARPPAIDIDTAAGGDSAPSPERLEPATTPPSEEPQPSRERTLARAVPPARERPDSEGGREDRVTPSREAPGAPTLDATVGGPADTSLPYQVATRQHLGRSESFLTSIRAELDEGGADPQVGPWARSLLVRTRLLLGSPAGSDAETRRLLEDLELMLAQIAIAAEARDPGETKILDRGLEEGNLLYRLRSATDGNIGNNARSPRASSL